MSKGGAISLVDGEIISLRRPARAHGSRGRCSQRPAWRPQECARRLKIGCWRRPGARSVARRCAPTSRGRPSRRTAMRSSTATGRRRTRRAGGESAAFESYFARLIPDEAERDLDVALARPQGAPAVDSDGRGDHGRRGIRVRSRHAVRHPRARLRQGLRRAVLVRGIDREGGRGALQRPARRRPVRRRQRGGRRGRAPAKPAPAAPTTP